MSTKKFIYPHNLRATANLWLWSLRDFTILCIAALLSAVSLVTIGFVVPAAATLSFGFLTIRRDERTVRRYADERRSRRFRAVRMLL